MSAFAYDESLMIDLVGFNIAIPKCLVEFRPHRKWVGEFGFDWVRTGDTNFGSQDIPEMSKMKYDDGLIDDNTDPFFDFAFQNCVGYVPYQEKTINEDDSEATKKEKQKENARRDKDIGELEVLEEGQYTYTNDDTETCFEIIYDKYRKLNNSDQLYKDLLRQYNSELIDEQRYYIPMLSLLEGNEAKLDLYITTEYPVEKIEIKVVGSTPKSVTLDKFIFEKVQTGKGDLNITVTCQQEFIEPLTLEAYRFKEGNTEGELCGKLILVPNSKKYQKEIKVLLIKVLTRLNDEDIIISKDKLQEIREGVTKFFAQALLIPQFEEIEIPLYDDAAQAILVQNSVILTDSDCVNMGLPKGSRALASRNTGEFSAKVHLMIKEQIPKEIEKQYKQYFKVFLVEEPLYAKSADYFVESSQQGGASLHADRGNLICFRAGNNSGTVAHEIFHSMGIGHIFSDFNAEKYCFKKKYTSNLMDYSNKRISIYYWQWKRINKNIK